MLRYLFFFTLLCISLSVKTQEIEEGALHLIEGAIDNIESTFPKLVSAVESCDSQVALKLKENLYQHRREIHKYQLENKEQARHLWSCSKALVSASRLSEYTTKHIRGKPEGVIGNFERDFTLCKRVVDENILKPALVPESTWPASHARPKQCIFPEEAKGLIGQWKLSKYSGKQSIEFDSGSLLLNKTGRCEFKLNNKIVRKYGENCEYWYDDGYLHIYNSDKRKVPTKFKANLVGKNMELRHKNNGLLVFERW